MPVSSEIAGSRMLTAEVFAFTTRVEMQVAARTPPAALVLLALPVATSLIEILPVTARPLSLRADGTGGPDELPSPAVGERDLGPAGACRLRSRVCPVP